MVVVVVVVKGILLDEEGAVLVWSWSACSQNYVSRRDERLRRSLRWPRLLVMLSIQQAKSRSALD